MKAKILGSGTGLIAKDRLSASVLLTIGKQQLLFDCGWGAVVNYYEGNFNPLEVDDVFITHPHPDHFGGLFLLNHSMSTPAKNAPNALRVKPLNLHGYKGIKKDWEQLSKIYWGEIKYPFEINFHEYVRDALEFDEFNVKTIPANHMPDLFNSVSYRIEGEEKSCVYSGDTGFNEELIDLAKDADLAILEMSISPQIYKEEGVNKNHLSPLECGIIAGRANVKQLGIVHYHRNSTEEAILKDIRENYSGKVILSKDLQEIDL